MRIKWIGCHADNFRAGRPAGLGPELIVLHATDRSAADAARTFFTAGTSRSAHYVVGRDGSVTQHVQETDTAFHAGMKVAPSAKLVIERPTVNPNFYSIGVELERGDAGAALTDVQMHAAAVLLGEIAARWRIPLDDRHVVPHHAIRASLDGCPPKVWPIQQLMAAARNAVAEHPLEQPHQVTVLSVANLRSSPDTSAAPIGTVDRGTLFNAVGVTRGQPVSGNDRWYVDASGRYLWAGATSNPAPAIGGEHPLTTDEMDLAPTPAPAPPGGGLQVSAKFGLEPSDYYATPTKKDLIVLHFTAGPSAKSAYDTWRSDPQHVATAYVVDTDGTIYEMFDPIYWAYHLGIKGAGPVHDKRSIGIEIANVGPLRLNGRSLNWWPSNFGRTLCSLDDTSKYRKAPQFRGFDYYASFPQAQVDATASLVAHLTERFGIKRTLPPADRQFEFDDQYFSSYQGVATHANFRKDKYDIGPAFDWDTLP